MNTYKRNQVEGALYAVMTGPLRTARERVGQPIPDRFRNQIKRLLELDLKWAADKAGRQRKNYLNLTFFDDIPDGTGTDINYTPFNALCLAIAVEFVRFGIKQGEALEKIAAIKSELENLFEEAQKTLKTDGSSRYVTAKSGGPTRELVAGKGPTPDPSIFLIVKEFDGAQRDQSRIESWMGEGNLIWDHEICRGEKKLSERLGRIFQAESRSAFVMDIAELTARILEVLEVQPLRKRGRKSFREAKA